MDDSTVYMQLCGKINLVVQGVDVPIEKVE